MSKYLGLSKFIFCFIKICLFVYLCACLFVCCGQFGCTCRKGILFNTKLFAFLHVTIINFAHFFSFSFYLEKVTHKKKLGGGCNWNLRVNLLRQTRQSFKNKFKIQKKIIKNCKIKMYCESKTILHIQNIYLVSLLSTIRLMQCNRIENLVC